jgi:two-component system, OmpR family, sensor histidine kinase MtrB
VRRRRYGLRTVVVATFTVAVTITTLAVSLVAYAVVRGDAKTFEETSDRGNYLHVIDLAEVNRQLRDMIAAHVGASPGDTTAESLTAYVQDTLGLRFAAVVDPSEPPLRCTYHPCWKDFPPELQSAARERLTYIGGALPAAARSTYWLAITPLDASIGDGHLVLAAAASRLGSETHYSVLWNRTAIVVGAGLVLSLLVGFAVSSSITRPLDRITAATERFGQGDVTVRAPDGGSDEVRRLGATFNRMADQLRTTLEELRASRDLQRRFVADVSHELRTPLSTMLATLDALDSGSSTSRHRAAVLLAEQTRRLAGLVEDLLEISRFDAGQAELRSEPVDLVALVQDAARSVATDAVIPVAVTGSALRVVDPRRMHTVVRNLLSNAMRHGIAPVTVDITQHADGTLTVTVQDQGPGIPAEARASIFDRFAQGTPARSGGTGLGLAIVQDNVRLHGGSLWVSDSAPTRFAVTLPASTAVHPDAEG